MKYCKQCGLPETYAGIRLDEDGVCNFCHFYNDHREVLKDEEDLERLFVSRLEEAKRKAKRDGAQYDCVVGLSGGKDSAYIIYQLKHKYGMRILSFTYDNGFSTEFGHRNVENALEKLDVDNITITPQKSKIQKYNKACINMFHNFCSVCFHYLHYYSHQIAAEKRIPLIVNGRSRGQVLQSVDNEKLIEPFERSECFKDFEYQMFGDKVERNARIGKLDYLEGYDIESLSYFMYHSYDAEQIMSFLEETIGWERPAVGLPHADCWAHAMAEKYSLDSRGYPILTGELAVMVREGEISVEEAARRRSADAARYQTPDPEIQERFNRTVRLS